MANPDFAPFLQRMKDAKPDAMFVFVPAGQGGNFMKQYAERGLDKSGIKVIGPGDVMDDDLLNGMGDAALGTVTAHLYSAAHPSAMNKEFVAAYKKAFGSRPGFMAVGGYDGIHLIYEALKKTGGKTDGDALIEAMKGMKWESPRGPISIDPETRDIVQNIYIRKVEKVDGELYNVEFADLRGRQGRRQDEEVTPAIASFRGAALKPRTRNLGSVCRTRIPGSALSRCPGMTGPMRSTGTHPMTTLFTILFDGVAYGMLLFVLACGLAVTLGLMNFVNLAHGAFAMTGGYVCAVLVNQSGWPFFAGLPLAFVASAADRRGAGALALSSPLHPQPSRSGAVQRRPRLHVGGGGRLHHGIVADLHQASGGARRARSISSASASAATG